MMQIEFIKRMQYEWIFVLGFLLAFTYVLFTQEINWVLVLLLIGFRIYKLENKFVIDLTTILLILLLTRFGWHVFESNRISQFPINDQELIVSISVDPMQLNIQPGYISGQGSAQLLDNHIYPSRFPITFVYFEDEESIEDALELEHWIVEGTFSLPPQARNFYTFDYQDYLAQQGIYWQLEITHVQSRYKQSGLITALMNLRNKLLGSFHSLNEQPWMAFHNKLMLNLDSDFYQAMKGDLRDFGILHFFAISGFHLVYIYRYLSYVLRRIGLQTEYLDGTLAILLLGYLFLTHFPVGLIRSYLTIHLRKIAKWFNLPLGQIDILAIIAIGWILINPSIILSLGFQLSFLMTYILNITSQVTQRMKNLMTKEMVTSLSCLMISWPILIQISHTWNGTQLIMILLTSVIFSRLIMPLVFITTILFLIPNRLGLALIQPLNLMILRVQDFIENFEIFDQFTIIIGRLTQLEMLMLIVGALYFIYQLNKLKRSTLLIPLCLYSALIIIKPYMNLNQTIHLIDVGQGDSMLIQYPRNQGNYLIDTGGRVIWGKGEDERGRIDQEFAHRNIIPALKALGVKKIDGLIITHMDIDHIGNLSALNKEFPIDTIYLSQISLEDPLWMSLEFTRGAGKIQIVDNAPIQINNHNLSVRQLPRSIVNLDLNDKNNQSLVIHATLNELQIINSGDLSQEGEIEILRVWPELRADILKLGHHGSNTSTSQRYLEEMKPILAINSAGVNNRYGHPHQDVVDLLKAQGIPYLSTHEYGAIQISYHPWFGYRITTAIKQ